MLETLLDKLIKPEPHFFNEFLVVAHLRYVDLFQVHQMPILVLNEGPVFFQRSLCSS